MSCLSKDMNIIDIVFDNINKIIFDIGKCMMYRKIIYFGIFYWCIMKRENGGLEIE